MKNKLTVPMGRTAQILGWIYWLFQLLLLGAALHLLNDHLPTPLTDTQLNLIFFAINFLAMTVIMWRFLGNSFREGWKRPWRLLQSAGMGLMLYFGATYLISLLIAWLDSAFVNANDASIAAMLGDNYVLTTLCVVVLVPVAEELMYRGLIFRSLYNRAPWAAYLVSTLVFAAIHLVGYIKVYSPLTLALCFLQYLPAGLCLGWAYARSNSIIAPILMHIAINQIGLWAAR